MEYSGIKVTIMLLLSSCGSVCPLSIVNKRTNDLIYGSYGPSSFCEVNGQLIPHGQIFTEPTMSRCLQHQCYYGSSFIHSEACEGTDQLCHEVDTSWDEQCISYTCTKTTIGGYNYFQPIVTNARCQDVHGQCHDPGDLFSYRLHGRLHNNCHCQISERRIYYRCY